MGHSARELIVDGNLRKALVSLALPMAVGSLAHTLFNLTDMYFVGRLGSVAIAAVGMAGVVLGAMIMLMVGLVTATRAMVARYVGADDIEGAHRAVVGSIWFGFIISVIIALSGLIFARIGLILMGAGGELLNVSTNYLLIMMVGGFSMVMLFIVNAILQGAGDARTAMIITVSAVALNIVLDPMFIFGIGPFPRWGVNGAAFATVLARFLGALIGFGLLLRGVKAFRLRLSNFHTNWATMKRFLRIGVPGGGQVLLAHLIGFVMMRIATGFGVAVTAAYTVGIRLNMMAMLPGFALGGGAATMVGQNLGAEKPMRAKRGALMAVTFYEIYIIPLGIIYFILAPHIMSLFSSDSKVISLGTEYLRCVSIIYPVFAIGTILRHAVNGSGKTVPGLVAVFIALYIMQLPVALILTHNIGPSAIWWSIAAGMAGQGILIIPYFFSMKWAETGRWR